MSKDFLKEIEELVGEAEAELEKTSALKPAPKSSSVKVEPKHVHYGHRERVKKSADTDPDFTTFSDIEMLEYLLFNTLPRMDTNVLAHKLIDTFGSFSGVLNASVNELKTVPYIGEETARMLTCILPAARKSERSRLRNNVVINNTAQAVETLWPFFMNRNVEYVYLASLNHSDRLISVDLISVGDTNFSSVEVKKIVEAACRHKASKVLISHNHPSGALQPSQADREVTSRLLISLLSINVILADHIVFTSEDYYSFFANGDFKEIYRFADSVFKTNLVQEIELKPNNYRAGIYPTGIGEDEINENGSGLHYSDDPVQLSYSLGHPDPKNFKIKDVK